MTMKKIHIKSIIMAMVMASATLTSCSGYLDTLPSDSLVSDDAITSIEDAKTALNGAYYTLITNTYYGNDFIARAEVGGDDVQTSAMGKRTENFYRHMYRQNSSPSGLWSIPYKTINRVNVLLKAIESGVIPETETLKQIKGEALTLRALCHFDLLITYGYPYLKDNGASLGVPLVETVLPATDLPARTTVAEGYTMVLRDLNNAKDMVSEKVVNGHINRWAIKSLIARVNLYKGDYDAAYTNAKDVVENGPYKLIPNDAYVASWGEAFTTEAIFELEITSLASGNRELLGYVANPEGYAAMIATTDFINLLNEDKNDVRLGLLAKDSEGKKRFINKLPGRDGSVAVNNVKIVRLSDVYLIAAEAALRKAAIDQTLADKCLNAIVKRASPTASTVVATKENIIKERRKELVMEGHRLYDALRLGLTISRIGGDHFLNDLDLVSPNWNDYRSVMAIPQAEIDANPNISKQQNPGY